MTRLVDFKLGANRLVVELKPGTTTIGRHIDNTVVISDGSVSSHHCAVTVSRDGIRVKDLRSSNDTYINNRCVREAALPPGHVLRLGNIELRLEMNQPPALKTRSSSELADLVNFFDRYRLSPVWRKRAALATTGILAGAFYLFVTGALPYYPDGWRILLAVAVACLWMVRPRLGTVLALIGLALPLAYNLPAACELAFVACVVLAVALPADSFLILAALVFSLVRAEWLLPAVPLAAGFLKVNRCAVTAGVACLFTELFLLLSGREPLSGTVGSPLIQLQTSPVASLSDWSWLEKQDWSWFEGQDGFVQEACMKLGKVFVDRPELIGHVFAWSLAALVVARLLRQRSNRFAPGRIVAVGGGALALFLGNSILSSFVGTSELANVTGIGSILIGASFVMLLAPAWTAVVSTLTAKSKRSSGAQPGFKETPTDDWSELAGVDDIKTEIREAVRSHFDTAERESLRRLSLQPPRGVLLFGPPGTGKTKLARLIAHEAKAAFYAISGTEFISKWYGESEANLRNIFETAREHRPSVLFFDELEAFLPQRAELSRSDAPEKGVLATFLAYTDGIANLDGVFLVGATNHPELIDPAALRPGRFDKVIYVSPPNAAARRNIFERYLNGQQLADDVNFDKLAALTERFTGADIQAVCKEAILQSVVRGRQCALSMAALVNAISGAKASVTLEMLRTYEKIADQYGRRSHKPAKVEVVAKAELGWEDVAGLDDAKNALREAVEMPLTHGEIIQQYGVKPPKGVLLYGPPGCGKTLLAKVVAQQAKAHFLHVRGPELLRAHTGQSESKLRELFDRARENAPCVLFFDEIDALAAARATEEASSTKILTQLLAEMDGVEELKGVVVVGATNRPDALDPALLRPGRFDRLVHVPPPDQQARAALFAHELRGKPTTEDLDFEQLASRTTGYSSADIANLSNTAAIECVRKTIQTGARQQISMQQLQTLIDRTSPSIKPEELARHEAFRGR